jgi:hypothetical protein
MLGSFSLRHRFQTGSGFHPASHLMGIQVLTPVVKRLGREADHSPPYGAVVKNALSYTSTPQYIFMAWFSVKNAGTALPLLLPYLTKKYPFGIVCIASTDFETVWGDGEKILIFNFDSNTKEN